MSLQTPYYDDGQGIVIYHGDCRLLLHDDSATPHPRGASCGKYVRNIALSSIH